MLMGVVLIFSGSCKKDDADDSANTVVDIDGNVYHTVNVGSQVWMVENLKVKHYNNGDPIGNGNLKSLSLSDPIGQVYVYNNDMANFGDYGFLYNWYAIADNRGLAPKGWHVPSDGEFGALVSSLGGDYYLYYGDSVAGGKLKEKGNQHWGVPGYPSTNVGATNSTGWGGLPGGTLTWNGKYEVMTLYGAWWSSTSQTGAEQTHAHLMCLSFNKKGATRGANFKTAGMSIRCIRDKQ